MAEMMHSKSNINRIKEVIAKLTSTQFHLMATQNSMATKLDNLLLKMAQLETRQHSPTSSTVNQHIVSPSPNPHRMKLEVSCFDGSNPLGWIFKITQFFEYHSTPKHERLTIASFLMEGLALTWFQWMTNNSQLASWPSLL